MVNTKVLSKTKLSKAYKKEMLWGYLFISPIVIGLVLFLSVPLIYSLFLSLTEYDLFNPPTFVGFANFIRAFTNEKDFWLSLLHAAYACVGLLISMFVTMLLANLLSKKLPGTKAFRMIFFLPTVCSAVALTIMWQNILDYHFGALNNILQLLNIDKINWMDEKHGMPSLIFMGIWSSLGINILLYLSAIKSVPETYYEAAKLDGANGIQMFFHITFKSISPVSFYILITGIIGTLQDFSKYHVFGNGELKHTIMPVLVIFNYSGNSYGAFYGYASTLAILLGAVIALITIFNFTLSNKWVHYES